MARKRKPQSGGQGPRGARGPRGTKGSRGATGSQGPPGPPGGNGELTTQLGVVLARVTQELEGVQNALKVQFTRIAELQADIDNIQAALRKPN